LIEKKLFLKKYNIQFDDSISTYGYEDLFFAINNNLKTIYIDNPLYHIGLKDADKFINDTEHAILNLIKHSNCKQITRKSKIIKVANLLATFYLDKIIVILFKNLKELILKNLHSKNPSITCLQFYKLGYFLEKKIELMEKRQ